MLKQIIPSCQYTNITPEYIIKMYERDDCKKREPEISLVLYDYIILNKIKQIFNQKNKKIPDVLNEDIKEDYDMIKKNNFKEVDITTTRFIDLIYNKFKDDGNDIETDIKEKFRKYNHIAKYADVMPETKSSFIENGKKVKNPIEKFKTFMGDKQGAKVFTYHHLCNDWSWLDENEFNIQFKHYKKLIKEKKIVIEKENNNEHMLNGKTWYSMTIQIWDKDLNDYGNMNICKGSMALFGYLISGYVYYFQSKIDRDNMYKWLVK